MIIKNITLNNFRQYKGKQVIEFSTDQSKNVTVLLGKNTSGKTTMIQAFQWCLYEDTIFKTKELINSEVVSEMSMYSNSEVSVEICLVHENVEYRINRSQAIEKTDSDKVKTSAPKVSCVYKKDSGETGSIRAVEIKDKINSILPHNLSNYFFFDGEYDVNKKSDVVSAIQGLMGQDVVIKARKYLNPDSGASVWSKLNKSLDVGSDQLIIKRKSEIDYQKEKLEGYKKRKLELEDEKGILEARQEEFSQLLLANAGVKEKQFGKIRCQREISHIEGQIPAKEKRLLLDFNKGAYKFFAKSLYAKAMSVISDEKYRAEGIPEMHADAIDYILKRGVCICGCDLTKNQGAVEKIEFEKSLLPPEHIGTTVRNYKDSIEQCIYESSGYFERIMDDARELRNEHNRLDDCKTELDNLSAEIEGCADVNKIEQDDRQNRAALDKNKTTLAGNARGITECETLIKTYEDEIRKYALSTDKNHKINVAIEYAQDLYDWFNESYEKNENTIRERLVQRIQDIFKEMYHGERVVEIDNSYKMVLKYDNGNGSFVVDTSGGLETVKNFAFACGLISVAKEEANTDGKEIGDIVSEAYPILMDAPFSKADDKHIENISKILPTLAEQTILFIMDKDWEYAKKTMQENVGQVLRINKIRETYSTIEKEGI